MKKTLCLLLTLLLVFSFASCGNDNDAGTDEDKEKTSDGAEDEDTDGKTEAPDAGTAAPEEDKTNAQTTAKAGDETSEKENEEQTTAGGTEMDATQAAALFEEVSKKYENNGHPVAVIVTNTGAAIAIELYEDIAPNTVYNFISLANSGFYDGIIFHRVIKNFMIQTGDPTGTGTGGPGYTIKGEFGNNKHQNDISHQPGVVSMARQGNYYNPPAAYNTAGSQFFICVADVDYLDNDYAAFGRVIEGMDAVYAISVTPTNSNDRPLTEQSMVYVRVATYGKTYPEPEKIAE